jgi:cytoskeletal protein CcmA (bactofilin family)
MAKNDEVIDSFLGDKSRLEGTLAFNGTLTLLGKFKGRIKGGEGVVLGEESESEAEVEARSVKVYGKIVGRIGAEKRIEIYKSAEIEADVSTPTLIIHEGAIFDGKCAMKRKRGRQTKEKIVDLKEGWMRQE